METSTAEKLDEYFTYEQYCKWDDGVRYELIDGVAYMMAAPSQAHQEISGNLYIRLREFLKDKTCKIFYAPFDVYLNGDKKLETESKADEPDTVLQPDLLIVCDKSKLNGKACIGAPDMVVEILSPSSGKHDTQTKYSKYLQAGVEEYWVVDPESKTLTAHTLNNGGYTTFTYSENQIAPVHILKDCKINLSDVFN